MSKILFQAYFAIKQSLQFQLDIAWNISYSVIKLAWLYNTRALQLPNLQMILNKFSSSFTGGGLM